MSMHVRHMPLITCQALTHYRQRLEIAERVGGVENIFSQRRGIPDIDIIVPCFYPMSKIGLGYLVTRRRLALSWIANRSLWRRRVEKNKIRRTSVGTLRRRTHS